MESIRYYCIITRGDNTIKALGPFESYKVAYAYGDFVISLNHSVKWYEIVKTSYSVNIWGSPYPFPIDQYTDGAEG